MERRQLPWLSAPVPLVPRPAAAPGLSEGGTLTCLLLIPTTAASYLGFTQEIFGIQLLNFLLPRSEKLPERHLHGLQLPAALGQGTAFSLQPMQLRHSSSGQQTQPPVAASQQLQQDTGAKELQVSLR